MADESENFERTAPTPTDTVPLDLARYILPSSGTMVGICVTLIGLVKINEGKSGPSRVDEYGALIAFAFLTSAILSYLAIRISGRRPSWSRRCERTADVFFMIGLVSIVGLGALFAFEAV